MQYTLRDQDVFPHVIELNIKKTRQLELTTFLNENIGKPGVVWQRVGIPREEDNLYFGRSRKWQIAFQDKKQAMHFKMIWDEDAEETGWFDWMQMMNVNMSSLTNIYTMKSRHRSYLLPEWKIDWNNLTKGDEDEDQ